MNCSMPGLPVHQLPEFIKLMPIKLVMPFSHLILCRPLLLLPPIPPSIRVFSSQSTLRIRWPNYWSFSFSISPSNEHPGLISFRWTGWISLQSKGLSRVFSNTTVQKHKFFGAQLSSHNSLRNYEMVKETRKRWPRKQSSVHTLCPSLAAPLAGNLGVSLALTGRYKPATRLPFLGLPSVNMRHHETTEQGSSFASRRACHSFTQAHHRISKVKQKMCILKKQRG